MNLCDECFRPLPYECATPVCDECLGKQCPDPYCLSAAQKMVGRRPDGQPRYECEGCGCEWSSPEAVVFA